MFVNALHADDQQFVALNRDLAQITDKLTSSDQRPPTRSDKPTACCHRTKFLTENREVLTHDVNNLGEATTAIMQPVPRDGLGDRAAHPAEHGG